MSFDWSPDSKWLAYTLTNRAGFQTIQLYALGPDQSHALTDGLIEAGEPAFDAGGKYLYFLGSTDAGPVKNWFDQSNTDMGATYSIYLVTLAKSTPNPLLKESDEESATGSDKDKNSKGAKDKTAEEKKRTKTRRKSDADQEKPAVVVDLEGIARRAVALPIESGHIAGLTAGSDGQIYYIRRVGVIPAGGPAGRGKPSLRRFDLKKREEETLAEGIDEFKLSADRKKVLYRLGDSGARGPLGGPGPRSARHGHRRCR